MLEINVGKSCKTVFLNIAINRISRSISVVNLNFAVVLS